MFFKSNIQEYISYFTFSHIKVNDIVEIIIFIIGALYLIKHFQNTRVWVLIKGVLTLFVLYALANLFSLKTISNIFQSIIPFFIIALIMMFQPELRKVLESFGTKNFSTSLISYFFKKKETKRFSDHTIQELASSVDIMSKAKTGALILIENDIPLDEYCKTGIGINSDISSQLIVNIFEKNTPLHDGAMIIKGDSIVSATCYLPLSQSKTIDKSLGTRHRAAIGASEQTDAFIIIVSEETGAISYVKNGKISHDVTVSQLVDELQSINYTVKPLTPEKYHRNLARNISSAIIFGAVSWIMFTFIYNPVETVTISDIPVEIINDNIIENLDKVYEITSGKTVTIEVTAPRDVIDTIKADDFKATADFSKLSITNTASVDVTSSKDVQIDTNNAVMEIKIEDASEIDLNIELEKTGIEQTGFYVYKLDTETPIVKVTGPKSIIRIIDKAVCKVDVSSKSQDFDTQSEIVLFDKNGDVIDKSQYSINFDKADIKAYVFNTKEVPVELKVTDDNVGSKKLEILSQALSSETIKVAASESTLKDIEKVVIPVDITDSASNVINSTIDITPFLPDGVYCASNTILEYNIEIGKFVTKEVTLSQNDITLKNGNGQVKTKKININLILDEDKDIDTSSLGAYIDIQNLAPGNYTLPLQFTNLDNMRVEDVYDVDITVK